MAEDKSSRDESEIRKQLDRKLDLIARIHEAKLGIAQANQELFKAGLSYEEIGKPCW